MHRYVQHFQMLPMTYLHLDSVSDSDGLKNIKNKPLRRQKICLDHMVDIMMLDIEINYM